VLILTIVELCRNYTMAEYEKRATEVQNRNFGASGSLPPRMIEVKGLGFLRPPSLSPFKVTGGKGWVGLWRQISSYSAMRFAHGVSGHPKIGGEGGTLLKICAPICMLVFAFLNSWYPLERDSAVCRGFLIGLYLQMTPTPSFTARQICFDNAHCTKPNIPDIPTCRRE